MEVADIEVGFEYGAGDRATEREITLVWQSSPSRSTVKSDLASCLPWVITFSLIIRVARSPSLALVVRTVESTPLIWVVSISM